MTTVHLDDHDAELLADWDSQQRLQRGARPMTPMEKLARECVLFLLGNGGDLSMLPEAIERTKDKRGKELEREYNLRN